MAAGDRIGDTREMRRVRSPLPLAAASLAGLAGLAGLATLTPSRPAAADVVRLSAQVEGGGMAGLGLAGDQRAKGFFVAAPHGTYGVQVGAKFLVFDGWVRHHQYTDGTRLATWTQLGVGLDTIIDLGDPARGQRTYVQLAMGLWFGLGTGQQVDLPLDNAQLSDKAFLGEGSIGLGTHLARHLDLGVTVPVSYGYFFKTGNGATANNLSTHYQGAQAEALLYLRTSFGL